MAVSPAMRSMDSIFEESRSKFRSQIDQMWQEMQREILNHRPLTFGSFKSPEKETQNYQQKQTAPAPKEETVENLTQVEQPTKSLQVAPDGSLRVTLPVSPFRPEELSVKVSGDSLLVEAHHQEKDEQTGSFSRRHFAKRFVLPASCDKEALASSLSDGVLTISAPAKTIAAAPSGKNVEIRIINATTK